MAAATSSPSKVDSFHLPHKTHKTRRQSNPQNPIKSLPCYRSRMALVDMAILIAALFAGGFLLFGMFSTVLSAVKAEFGRALCVHLGVGTVSVALAMGIYRRRLSCRKCDKPDCQGLKNAAEFDIKIESEEECLKNSGVSMGKDDVGKGFFELNGDQYTELGAELKKIAPLNGRAILIFRAKCGCSAGRMVVWGQKKLKKAKK